MIKRRSYSPLWFELLAAGLAKLLYRVRSSGADRTPEKGGVVLVANHLSYADPVVLQFACSRRIRFLGYRGDESPWYFNLVFRLAGVIAISPDRPTEGIRRAVKALAAGECVCLFVEGHISRTGQLMPIKKGFGAIARRGRAPVVPVAVDGLWGSVFSFAGNRYLWKSPRLTPADVFIAYGDPIEPERADETAVRKALLDLGAAAFGERPALRRHLGREVVRALAKRPGRIAFVDRTSDRRAVRAGALLAVSAALARRIRATVPEKRVGIVLPPGAGGFIANLAVVCAGKIPVNLNFTAGRPTIEAGIRLAGVGTVLSAEAMREKAPNFPWPERTLDLRREIAACGGKRALLPWLAAAWLLPNQWVAGLLGLPRFGDREEAALLFTSGSAGEPKGVVLTHRNLLSNCAQISSLSIFPQAGVLVGCLPLFHSFGFTVTLWYPLIRGCRVVTVPSPLDTRRLAEAISEERATVLVGAPTFLRPLLRKARPAELRTLELVVAGAEKLSDELRRAFLEVFKIEILEGYGLTETAPVACVNQPNPPVTTATASPQTANRAGTVGRLLPGIAARIVDPDTGLELRETEQGVVWLRGANVFSSYLGDEAATRTAIRNGGWFATGDVGRFDEDGFLVIEGRLSRFSKIGGEMVPHGVVERKIVELFELEGSEEPPLAVVGIPDAVKGESLAVLSVPDLSADSIRRKLADAGLPNLWIPRKVVRLERIPLLGSGKLDLGECRRLAEKGSVP